MVLSFGFTGDGGSVMRGKLVVKMWRYPTGCGDYGV